MLDLCSPTCRQTWRDLWSTQQRGTISLAALLLVVGFAVWSGFTGLWNHVEHNDLCAVSPTAEVPIFRCDINTAGWAELAQLPGIGATLAQRIIDWRTEQGPYADVGQLIEIRGIGEKKLAALRPYVRVDRQR